VAAVKLAIKCLAQRHQMLTSELATLDRDLDRLVAAAAPTLCARKGVGTDVAEAVLVAAGDNPERLRSEGAFANLCGVAPLPASSGKISGRHRLNRGGDRHANCALWRVVIVRLATHEPTRNYMARRTQEGMSKPEIIRCLKRYVAREIYRELVPRAALAAAA
jgi:transposase